MSATDEAIGLRVQLTLLKQELVEKEQTCIAAKNRVTEVEGELNVKEEELRKMKRLQWKLTSRVFIDDVEAIYDTEFRHHAHYITYPDFPYSDLKAQSIRQRQEKWKWLFVYHASSPKIIDVLREANVQFRKLNNIPQLAQLNANQLREFELFKNSLCLAIAEVHELGSLIINGDPAFEVFQGKLETLNVFGPNDKFLLPFLRAVAPIVNPNLPLTTFHSL